MVSTHSRPKAAGTCCLKFLFSFKVSTHSRPKAAGRPLQRLKPPQMVSTHSRPKAAGRSPCRRRQSVGGFNTQPPEGGWPRINSPRRSGKLFQHTAARRRLGFFRFVPNLRFGFNTQPPEGGWALLWVIVQFWQKFQHTAARRRLATL